MPYLLISTQIRLVSPAGTPGGGEYRGAGRDRPGRAVRPAQPAVPLVRSRHGLALLLLWGSGGDASLGDPSRACESSP